MYPNWGMTKKKGKSIYVILPITETGTFNVISISIKLIEMHPGKN